MVSVCGHAVALNKNAEDTVRLLRMDIERKEKMCVEAKSAATVEKYQCDIFRYVEISQSILMLII